MSSASLQAALSDDGNLVAVVAPSFDSNNRILRVLVFRTSTGTLQTTLTHRSPDSTTRRPRRIAFCGSLILALLSDRLVAWDLKRGVVSYEIPTKKDGNSFDDVACWNGDSFYVLVSVAGGDDGGGGGGEDGGGGKRRLMVHEYVASSGKMSRKIKAGKGSGRGIVATSEYLAIRSGDGIRVLDIDTGSRVSKNTGLSDHNDGGGGTSSSDERAPNLAGTNSPHVVTVSGGELTLIHLPTGKSVGVVGHNLAVTSGHVGHALRIWSPVRGDNHRKNDGGKSSYVVTDGVSAYHLVPRDHGDGEDDEDDDESYVVEGRCKIPPHRSVDARCLIGAEGSFSMVSVSSTSGRFAVRTVSLMRPDGERLRSEIQLPWEESERDDRGPDTTSTTTAAAAESAKRKAPGGQGVIGAGQAGGEALRASEAKATKKPKLSSGGKCKAAVDDDEDDEEEGPSISERLRKLQEELDRDVDVDDDEERRTDDDGDQGPSAAIAGRVTTESLGNLLRQALRSGDDGMLESALAARDPSTVRRTCRDLPDDVLPALLNALASRLANRPARADALCPWLRAALSTGRIRSVEHLQPLRNLIQERVEIFPHLLKLEGRLAMMGSL